MGNYLTGTVLDPQIGHLKIGWVFSEITPHFELVHFRLYVLAAAIEGLFDCIPPAKTPGVNPVTSTTPHAITIKLANIDERRIVSTSKAKIPWSHDPLARGMLRERQWMLKAPVIEKPKHLIDRAGFDAQGGEWRCLGKLMPQWRA
jgi:hypothetical protein